MDHLEISRNCLPADLKKWETFFDRVNASFFDFDQERYLLERSMELSSAEFLEINKQFEQAESIAHIGHWSYRANEDKILWSKEVFSIFGIQEGSALPGYHQFLELIHEEDRDRLNALVEAALTKGEAYELEMRIYFQPDQSVHWILVKGIGTFIEQSKDEQSYKYNLSGIVLDIDTHKRSEEELKKLNAQFITISRQAGMSEVAVAVLHNIGNILNSANVSIVMLQELLKDSQANKLENISKMIKEGIVENPEYLLTDSKGKLIPAYLSGLYESLTTKHKKIVDEIEGLNKCLEHINDIVLMQNSISGISGIIENISIQVVCNQAIQMSYLADKKNDIKIQQHFEFKGDIYVDKAKILQLLVNLIRNANEALTMRETQDPKVINLFVREYQKGLIEIQISDNGIGIEKEYLKQIFSMGFTTKSHGHGFGLHMSAISAQEMGGRLMVASHGMNQGATFTLQFPIKYSGERR